MDTEWFACLMLGVGQFLWRPSGAQAGWRHIEDLRAAVQAGDIPPNGGFLK